jgi:hypothetical protein
MTETGIAPDAALKPLLGLTANGETEGRIGKRGYLGANMARQLRSIRRQLPLPSCVHTLR